MTNLSLCYSSLFFAGRIVACYLFYGRVATRLNGTKVPTAVLYTSRKDKHAPLGLNDIFITSLRSILPFFIY